jgi:hypothetical protein
MYYLKALKINIIIYTFFTVLMGLLWLFPKDEITALLIVQFVFIGNIIINITLYLISKRYLKKDLLIPKALKIVNIVVLILSIIPLLVRVDLMVELYLDVFKKK